MKIKNEYKLHQALKVFGGKKESLFREQWQIRLWNRLVDCFGSMVFFQNETKIPLSKNVSIRIPFRYIFAQDDHSEDVVIF